MRSKRALAIWAAVCGVVAASAGVALHFVYGMFGGEFWAVTGSVNESTWEHLKLVYWPVSMTTVIEYLFYGRKRGGFLTVRVIALLAGMAVVVTAFYTYRGVLGYSFLAADVVVFLMGVTAVYIISYLALAREEPPAVIEKDPGFFSTCAFAAMISLAMLFILFTFAPPHIGLFMDPVTEDYGLKNTDLW